MYSYHNFGDIGLSFRSFEQVNLVNRIWLKDYQLWKPTSEEITNRLGWLELADRMTDQLSSISSFTEEILKRRFQNVVLLGMGGSSLGVKVLGSTFGFTEGYPRLIVLDSILPAEIARVSSEIDISRTLFIVSSKSGSTIESLLMYQYFKNLLLSQKMRNEIGQNFVAITDAGTPLEKLAKEDNFFRIFTNYPDIGGRYSVLSFFGLVPAALIGVDIEALLSKAKDMQYRCYDNHEIQKNPGACLGTIIGTMAAMGRDKLTVITSPQIAEFGLWVEQLLAESTGKEGKGLIPIIDEPLTDPEYYGHDRIFVYLRMEEDENIENDNFVRRLVESGKPVLTIKIDDKLSLGAEFYRWEFATAVTGAVLKINPFNQPDVQSSKKITGDILDEYNTSGSLPVIEAEGSINELLLEAQKDRSYLAIMAYLPENETVFKAVSDLRRRIITKYGIATTFGFGPRLLHSTGQLHKGGPNSGLFIQFTVVHENDLTVPDKPYTFGNVADAQSSGDLKALITYGRRVVKIHIKPGYSENIDRVINELLI